MGAKQSGREEERGGTVRKISLLGVGIALFVVLSLCLQVPVFENYYLCLGYAAMMVYCCFFGTLSGMLTGTPLVRRKETSCKGGAPLERPLHACNLENAYAHTSLRHGYSTVTDLARLRGLSTSQPRSRAT